jgi:nitrate/nitrite-specific signal transduction histidine kinase
VAAREQLPSRLGSALDELRATLDRASELARQIETRPEGAGELKSRLADIESDREELSAKLAEYEHQVQRLMNLYVATYQLHATLDPGEVQATIAEIAINLLGAERFVLLFWKTDSAAAADARAGECEIALAQGMEDDASGFYQNGVYAGGDPAVDATLADGVLRIGPIEGSDALACVPLAVQGATVGALVILKLFDHKERLRPEDRDLLDLIAAHAASALFAARVYSVTDRKLKTLESLVALVRRQ